VRSGALFVQYEGSVVGPLYALLALLDPAHWKPLQPERKLDSERFFLSATPRDRVCRHRPA
jgi:hypothetical protein